MYPQHNNKNKKYFQMPRVWKERINTVKTETSHQPVSVSKTVKSNREKRKKS
jgi:hypothetical protein